MSKKTWQLLSVVLDVVFVNLATISAFYVRFSGEPPVFNFRAYTNLAVFLTFIQIVFLYVYDLYEPERTESGAGVFSSVTKAVTIGMLVGVSLSFFVRFFSFPRTVFVYSWLLAIVYLAGWRLLGARVLRISWPPQNVLVVGTGELGKQVVKELQDRKQWGYRLVGLVARKESQVGKTVLGVKVVGIAADIVRLVEGLKVDRVIVTAPLRQRELLERMAHSREADVKVEIVPDLYEIFIGRVDHNLLSDIPLVELTKDRVQGWVVSAKALIDRVGSVALLVILSPVMLATALTVRLTSPGPALFKQERIGKGEKPFTLYKFRTMFVDAEAVSGPVLATEGDPRVTRVGGFLRRYRLDELPQLFNILIGNMSFVGPRPERLFFVKRFKRSIPGYQDRYKVKPGVTGLAQVSGTYATTAANKLKYDLIYVYHQSLFLDLRILFNTIKVVLTARGSR